MAKQLTPKQLHFARCVAQGMTQADAYREAYNPREGTTAASIHTLASRLMGQVEIRTRVDALVAARERAVAASAVTDREAVVSKLRVWMTGEEETDASRLRAAELLGKASGLFATEVNVNTKDRDPGEVAAEIEARLAAVLGAQAEAAWVRACGCAPTRRGAGVRLRASACARLPPPPPEAKQVPDPIYIVIRSNNCPILLFLPIDTC